MNSLQVNYWDYLDCGENKMDLCDICEMPLDANGDCGTHISHNFSFNDPDRPKPRDISGNKMNIDDDIWAESWLDRTYGGAPDECSKCFQEGHIIKIENCQNPKH